MICVRTAMQRPGNFSNAGVSFCINTTMLTYLPPSSALEVSVFIAGKVLILKEIILLVCVVEKFVSSSLSSVHPASTLWSTKHAVVMRRPNDCQVQRMRMLSQRDQLGTLIRNEGVFPLWLGPFGHIWTQQSHCDAEQDNWAEITWTRWSPLNSIQTLERFVYKENTTDPEQIALICAIWQQAPRDWCLLPDCQNG